MKIYAFVSFILVAICLFSQDSETHYALKLYNGFPLNPTQLHTQSPSSIIETDTFLLQNPYRQRGFLNLSPALTWNKNARNLHEISVSQITWRRHDSVFLLLQNEDSLKTVGNVRENGFCFAVRYEYLFAILKKAEKISPKIGVGIQPYCQIMDYLPFDSGSFPSRILSAGVQFQCIPRLNVKISRRWFADVNMPATIFTTGYTLLKEENPSFPIILQKTYIKNTNFPFALSLNFGFGFRL